MTAVSLPQTTAIRVTTSERLALRAADSLAAFIHRRAQRRAERQRNAYEYDRMREEILAESRRDAMRAMSYDVPRMW